MDKYAKRALALANAQSPFGERAWNAADIRAYQSLSDGCSGKLSWAYGLAGEKISCHDCCVLHDFLYEIGGDAAARKEADKLLRQCAWAVQSTGGWLGRKWRQCRAWIMYAAVRLFAGKYWAAV